MIRLATIDGVRVDRPVRFPGLDDQRLVASVDMPVDLWTPNGSCVFTDCPLQRALECIGGVGVGELAGIVGALRRCGTAFVGDYRLERSTTAGRRGPEDAA